MKQMVLVLFLPILRVSHQQIVMPFMGDLMVPSSPSSAAYTVPEPASTSSSLFPSDASPRSYVVPPSPPPTAAAVPIYIPSSLPLSLRIFQQVLELLIGLDQLFIDVQQLCILCL